MHGRRARLAQQARRDRERPARLGVVVDEEHAPSGQPGPGGVRQLELQAAGDRSITDSLASLVREWTARRLAEGSDDGLYQELLDIVEPPLLKTCLDECDGQYAAAARRLGLHRTTLRKKADGHGIE